MEECPVLEIMLLKAENLGSRCMIFRHSFNLFHTVPYLENDNTSIKCSSDVNLGSDVCGSGEYNKHLVNSQHCYYRTIEF